MARHRKKLSDVLGISLATEMVFARPKKKKAKTKAPTPFATDLSPYTYDEPHVRHTIINELNRGNTDRALVAVEVCEKLFRGYVVFPPGPEDTASAQLVWALVVDCVDDICTQHRISERPWSEGSGIRWELRQLGDPGYPWEEPSLDVDNAPIPSTFIEVGIDNGPQDYDGLIRGLLSNALILGGSNPELANGTSSTSKRLRRETRKLFNDIDFHDKLYGQTNLRYAGGEPWMLNAHGRGLNWKRHHANNLERLSRGQSVKRTTSLGGRPLPAPNGGDDAMLLWLPAIDPQGLRSDVLTVRALVWSDGTSTREPPPVVQRLGVEMSGVQLSGGRHA